MDWLQLTVMVMSEELTERLTISSQALGGVLPVLGPA